MATTDDVRTRLGIGLPTVMVHRTVSGEELLDLTLLAEESGFSTVWAGDHVLSPTPILEPISTIAYLASETTSIDFGTGVLLAGLRGSEQAVADVQALTSLVGRRLILGVGAGGDWPVETVAAGLSTTRGEALDHALDAIRDASSPQLRILVGGRSQAALRRATSRGAGWLGYLESLRTFRAKRERLMELAGPTGVTTALVLLLAVTGSAGAADEAEHYLRRQFRGALDALRHLAVVGDSTEVAARIAAFLGAGCDHLLLQPITADPKDQLLRLNRDVVPRVAAELE